MLRLLMSSIKRQKSASGLFLVACILIFIMIPLTISSLQEVHTEVETNITDYARGSYDLLVRPIGSQHSLEESLGIVPENYLGVGDGGITMSKWESIKNNPEIDIAAPVAALGYYTGIRTNIGISPIPEESTRYIIQYHTTDGVNRYPVGKEYVGILLETPLPGQKFEELYNEPELMNEFRNTAPMFPFPLAYHLIVGIDPESESALTGIIFDDIESDSGASGWGRMQWGQIASNAPILPVMQLRDGTVSLQADIKVDTLGFDIEDVQAYRDRLGLVDQIVPHKAQNYTFINIVTEEYDELVDELTDYPEAKRQEINIDLKDYLHPFPDDYEAPVVNEKGEISLMDPDGKYMALVDLLYASTYYTAGDVKYEKGKDKLIVKQVGVENGVPTYREVSKKGVNIREIYNEIGEREEDIDLILDPVGEYSVGTKKEALAASPLGIYRLEPTMYKGDGEEASFPMEATITPGSFVPAPASGVTNIEAAAEVKGDKPIDAIRVKVGGISGYTPEAAEKIEQVAKDIEAMGLQVTIVAGASHQLIDVEVEGVGLVQEAWTTLGAAGSIISQWNVTNVILAMFFLLVSFIYIYNRILFWHVHQQRDIAILQRLGWDNKHVLRLFTGEIGVLTLLSWLFALGGLYLVQLWFRASGLIYLWQIGLIVATFLLLAFMMYNNLRKPQKTKRNFSRTVLNKTASLTKSLVHKNIAYFNRYIKPPFVQLLIVSALSSFVYLSLTETVQQTNLTVLGQYINVQASGWHFLLIISAYVLALTTLIEGLTSLLASRQREIGLFRSLGWKLSHIFKLYIKEVITWTGIAVFLGSATSLIIYTFIFELNTVAWLVTGASFIGLYICTVLVSSIMLYRLLVKELSDTLSLKRKGNKRNKKRQAG